MDQTIYFFENLLINFKIEKNQIWLNIENFYKMNIKQIKLISDGVNIISFEYYKLNIPKSYDSSRKLLLELIYNRILIYDQFYINQLFFFKFKTKKKINIFKNFILFIIYDYNHLIIDKPKKIKPIKFDRNNNEEQLFFITHNLENGKVYGPPGTGKTRTIISKISYSIEQKIFNYDGFIVLTFSKNSMQDFIEKLNHNECAKRVKTFHSLAGYILSILCKGLKSTNQSIDTCVYRCTQLLQNNNINNFTYFKNTKVIFIDEAQDINITQYEFIKVLSEKLNASLILVGDPNQCIYRFQNASNEYLINHNGFKIELTKNYRSSNEIVDIINKCAPIKNEYDIISVKGYNQNKPKLFIGSINDILNDLYNIFSNTFNDKVAIIGPVRKSRIKGDLYANIGLNTIVNFLEERKLKYNICYDDNEKIELTQRKKISIQPGIINLLTIHGSKGLEFDRVYLINYHLTSFTIIPSIDEYEDLKYLWYVALSRAKNELKIYALNDKIIWPLHILYQNFIESNIPIYYPNIKLKENIKDIKFWTDIISDRLILNETNICKLEDLIGFEMELIYEIPKDYKISSKYHNFMNTFLLFSNNKILVNALIESYSSYEDDELIDYDELSCLYGMWAEETFMYAYKYNYCHRLNKLKNMIETLITIDEIYVNDASKMIKKFNRALILYSEFQAYKKICNNNFFIKYIDDKINNKDIFFCFIPNINQYFNKDELIEKIKYYESKSILDLNDIFNICLFHYQYDYEKKNLIYKNFKEHLIKLSVFDKKIRNYANSLPDGYQFQVKMKLPLLPINGIADAIFNNKIIEFKFSKNKKPSFIHMLQLLGYAEMYDGRNINFIDLEILNLYHLSIYKIKRKKYNRYLFYKLLSNMINIKLENCCWIYDLETTNLISEDNEHVSIMEIHVEELSTGIIPISSLVKIGNIQYDENLIESLNGITRDMCNQYGIDKNTLIENIKEIINISNGIFIAHNGNMFDHKIITNYIQENFRKLDTLQLIPLFYDDMLKSKKLSNLYETIIGIGFSGKAHRASADVKMMIEIMHKLNLNSKIIHELNPL